MKTSFQSSIASEIVNYISLKQALGRRFEPSSTILLKLDQFLCERGNPSPDLDPFPFRGARQRHTDSTVQSLGRLLGKPCLLERAEPGQ